MIFTSEKYNPLDSRFNPSSPKSDLRSCLIWFFAFIVIVPELVLIPVFLEFCTKRHTKCTTFHTSKKRTDK